VQVAAKGSCVATVPHALSKSATEPYHPAYFMINGRSMPDDMDPNMPQSTPTNLTTAILTCIQASKCCCASSAQGRWQHPFHEHGNHVRILGATGT